MTVTLAIEWLANWTAKTRTNREKQSIFVPHLACPISTQFGCLLRSR